MPAPRCASIRALDGDGEYDDLGGTGASNASVALAGNVIRTVGLQVGDGAGGVDSARVRLSAGNAAPTAQILAPAAPLPNWRVGDVIELAGAGTDPEQGNLTGDALEWQMILRHCSDETFLDCHSHIVSGASGNHVAFDAPDHEYPSHLRFRLTARDAANATGSAQVDLFPAVTVVTLATRCWACSWWWAVPPRAPRPSCTWPSPTAASRSARPRRSNSAATPGTSSAGRMAARRRTWSTFRIPDRSR